MTPSRTTSQRSEDMISIREYIDTRIAAMECANTLLHDAQEHRIDSLNALHKVMRERESTFVLNAEYISNKDRVLEDIRSLRESSALLEGKASQSSVTNVTILTIISLLLGLGGLIWNILGS